MWGKTKEKNNFNLDFEVEQSHDTASSLSTSFGRAATTIATAKQYHIKQERTNPKEHILNAIQQNCNYYGQSFEDSSKPFVIPQDEITHSLYVGSTGTGKGVVLGNRVYQSILENKGVVVIDPKNDSFLPQIIKETLKEQNRPKDDFQMCYFPNKWGYKSITEDDTYLEISNKFIEMFDFLPSENPGVDYYRSNSRTLLRRLMKMFFVNLDLKKSIKKDFLDIKKHIILLKEDLEKQKMYDFELGKTRPNAELLEKFSKRYFDPEILENLYFATSDISTLDTLSNKFTEVTEGVTFTDDIDVKDALYKGKILYIKVDMNDIASLQFIKLIIVDIIQKAKKKKADCQLFLDECSFYASQTLANSLAVVRSIGLNFSLFLQALSQFNDEIRDSIVENCNFKIFYKSSNRITLEFMQDVLGGVEAITKVSLKDGETSYSQDFEPYLNITKIRALPRTGVMIVISEFFSLPYIVQTNFIATKKEFDWSIYRDETVNFEADKNIKTSKRDDIKKLEKYRVYLKESKNLLENSDLFGITLGSELI